MGIHYDYKNTRGAKKLQKQHEKDQRRLSKKSTQTADTQEETVQCLQYREQLICSETLIHLL